MAGRYRLSSRIGVGSMGEVWRADDLRLNRRVAVKLVDLSASSDPTVGERFRREYLAMSRLDDPSVVSVFDGGVDGSTAYLVMELLQGTSLAEVLRTRGRLPVGDSLRIARAVAQGLAAAHGAGLVHRDVKPANVMLADGRVKVLDFGIAQFQGFEATLTAPQSAIGTAAYMSPEQAMGLRVGPASDLYSLGCLLTTLLTGQPPFVGDSAVAVAAQQVSAEAGRLSDRVIVPQRVDDLVARLLAKRPEDRPTAADTSSAITEILLHPGPLARPAPVAPEPATEVIAPVMHPVQATTVMPSFVAPGSAAAAAAGSPRGVVPLAPARPPLRRRRSSATRRVLITVVVVALGVGAYMVGGTVVQRVSDLVGSDTRSSPTSTSSSRQLVAAEAVGVLIDRLDVDETVVPGAKAQLQQSWSAVLASVRAGDDPGGDLDAFTRLVAHLRAQGAVSRADAAALQAAVLGVRSA